jgi:hypothetical protein
MQTYGMTLIGLPCIIDVVILIRMVSSIHWGGCRDAIGGNPSKVWLK